jgi:hypothetical protein
MEKDSINDEKINADKNKENLIMRTTSKKEKINILKKREKALAKRSIKSFERGETSLGKRQLKQSLSIGDRIIRIAFKHAGHGVPASKRH